MCTYPLQTALHTADEALRRTSSQPPQPLTVESLHCTIRYLRRITSRLAELAGSLADQPAATPEIGEDLRALAKHLATGDLLLEPADDDLAMLSPASAPPPVRQVQNTAGAPNWR